MELNKIIKSAISSALAFSMLGSIYNLDLISVNAAVSTIKGDANGDGGLRASDAAFITPMPILMRTEKSPQQTLRLLQNILLTNL